ncbi:MAG: hypothetical protein HKO66_06760 [Saprospiraceae bacterium]|nr:hypothetical protein [Bacteroidia bacterium]NNL91914.1 hypothetical protein [Saprospiraceae bacterium]
MEKESLNTLAILEIQGHHLQWNESLNEMIHNLKLFEKQLSDISRKNNSLVTKKLIGHFQNRFFIQKTEINQLKNAIKKHELSIKRKKEISNDKVTIEDERYHNRMALQFKAQEIIFYKLKFDYADFVKEN